jgi:hypothetical protein
MPPGMGELREVIESADFTAGARTGVVVALALAIVASGWRAWRGRRLAIGGLGFAGAALFALDGLTPLPSELLVGTAALAAAGLTGDLLRLPVWVQAPLSVPGAWLVGFGTDVNGRWWTQALVTATAVVGGSAMADFDRRWRQQLISGGLLAIAVLGVFATVPDTEAPQRILVAAVLIGALGWPVGVLRFGAGGSYAAVGVVAWVAAVGGIGRAGSIVGGVACLGLLVAEPVARVLARIRGPLLRRPGALAAIGMGVAQVALVAVMSRVAGFEKTKDDAAVIAGTALAVSIVVCVVVARWSRRRRSQSGGPTSESLVTR